MHINSKYEIILLPVIKSIIIVIKLNNDIPMVYIKIRQIININVLLNYI